VFIEPFDRANPFLLLDFRNFAQVHYLSLDDSSASTAVIFHNAPVASFRVASRVAFMPSISFTARLTSFRGQLFVDRQAELVGKFQSQLGTAAQTAVRVKITVSSLSSMFLLVRAGYEVVEVSTGVAKTELGVNCVREGSMS
jgi:hypothetical protein